MVIWCQIYITPNFFFFLKKRKHHQGNRGTMKKRKTVLAIRLLLLVTAVLIMTAGIANATPTATRTLPAELVPADRSFPVEIEVSDYGTVVETLPNSS
jgi:hypothetical protein